MAENDKAVRATLSLSSSAFNVTALDTAYLGAGGLARASICVPLYVSLYLFRERVQDAHSNGRLDTRVHARTYTHRCYQLMGHNSPFRDNICSVS